MFNVLDMTAEDRQGIWTRLEKLLRREAERIRAAGKVKAPKR